MMQHFRSRSEQSAVLPHFTTQETRETSNRPSGSILISGACSHEFSAHPSLSSTHLNEDVSHGSFFSSTEGGRLDAGPPVQERAAAQTIFPQSPYDHPSSEDYPAMGPHQFTFSARASSLSHQNAMQFRALDRRKSDVESLGTYRDDNSDDTDDRESKFDLSTDSHHSQISEISFPSPKGSEKRIAYPFPHDRPRGPTNPLISFVKNEWQHPPRSKSPPIEEDDICPEMLGELLCSRACKRWLLLYFILMAAVWIWWFHFYGPKYAEDSFVRESLHARLKSGRGHFGMNMRVSFAGLTQLRELDRRLVPGSEVKGTNKRRLVIVGDIHGCYDEFNSLLDATGFNPERDHLIATGDSISKGPKSGAVLDALHLNNASSVRGNHEDKILHAYRDHNAPSHQKYVSAESSEATSGPVSLKQGARANLELAASLTEDQVRYMRSFPLILSLGPIPGMGNVSVVHGGLTPGVALLRQDPVSVMSMRSIDLRNHMPSPREAPVIGIDKPDLSDMDRRSRLAIKPWTVMWNAWQEMQPKSERETVIYGHDSKKGVVQEDWSVGLDGACVYGGKLAALVIEETGWRDVKKGIVTVPCKDYMSQKVLRPLGEN